MPAYVASDRGLDRRSLPCGRRVVAALRRQTHQVQQPVAGDVEGGLGELLALLVQCGGQLPDDSAQSTVAAEQLRPAGRDRAAYGDVLAGHDEGDRQEVGAVRERHRTVDVAQRHTAGPELGGRGPLLLHPGRAGERYEEFVRAPGIGPDTPGVPLHHFLAAGTTGEAVALRLLPLQASGPRSVTVRHTDPARAVEAGEDLVPGARRGEGESLAPGVHASS